MLVNDIPCPQTLSTLQILFHLIQSSRIKCYYLNFELKKLSLERLGDLNKVAQLIETKPEFSL